MLVAAPAKVNLALHVTGRRGDGYHMLDSLVAFGVPDDGDALVVEFADADANSGANSGPNSDVNSASCGARADRVDGARRGDAEHEAGFTVLGPFADAVPAGRDNIVMRAVAVAGGVAAVRLWKGLPVASGIGGGSADAAALLLAVAVRRGLPAAAFAERALTLGADVPVCLAGRATRMGGIGERLAPVALPAIPAVLVNPGIPVATGAVFAALARCDNGPLPPLTELDDVVALASWLDGTRNDLEAAAVAIAPAIGAALAAVRAQPGCLLARMSGSGGTVFGLFADAAAQASAAVALRPTGWWVRPVMLGDAPDMVHTPASTAPSGASDVRPGLVSEPALVALGLRGAAALAG